MLRYYDGKAFRLRFTAPYTLTGVASDMLGLLLFVAGWMASLVPANYFVSPATLGGISRELFEVGGGLIDFACLLFLGAGILYKFTPDSEKIRHIFALSSVVRTGFRPRWLVRSLTLPVFRFCSASRYTVHLLTEYALAIPSASWVQLRYEHSTWLRRQDQEPAASGL